MKIVVCTEYGGNYAAIAGHTVPVMRKYCEKHGYELRVLILEGTGNEYAYKKHELFKELLREDNDVIAYFDADILITNHTIKIESFLDDDHDLFITYLVSELNGGALIIKNSMWGEMINNFILNARHNFENEQNVINHYRFHPMFSAKMKVVPHPSFNSMNYDYYPELSEYKTLDLGHWVEGESFVLHTPGLGIEQRLQVLKNTPIKYE